jgi:hypothetical protein
MNPNPRIVALLNAIYDMEDHRWMTWVDSLLMRYLSSVNFGKTLVEALAPPEVGELIMKLNKSDLSRMNVTFKKHLRD